MFSFAQQRSTDNVLIPRNLLNELELFQKKPELLSAGKYTITSDVDPEVVGLFFSRVGGDTDRGLTLKNAEQMRELCDELGFSGFDDEIRAALSESDLRSRVDKHDVLIEELQRRVLALQRQMRMQEKAQGVKRGVKERRYVKMNADMAKAKKSEDAEPLGSAANDGVGAADMRTLSEEVAALKQAEAKKDASKPKNQQKAQVITPASAVTQRKGISEEVAALKESEAVHAPTVADTERTKGGISNVKTEFAYDSSKPLEGIIAYLARECGANVHNMCIVEVTASSHGEGKTEHVVEFRTDSDFCSKDEPNSWIRYDFKGQPVTPTSYSIMSGSQNFPVAWVLEVSHDAEKWEIIDRRDDNSDLGKAHVVRNFTISVPPSRSFRFIRLRLTGENNRGNDILALSALEVFGTFTNIPRPVARPGEFPFYAVKPLDGVIAHLTRECRGNAYTHYAIDITMSSIAKGQAKYLVEFETKSQVESSNQPNQWIRYDFRGRSVAPKSYSIRSGCSAPRRWVFEVSNDGKNWQIVDRRDDNDDLKDNDVIRNFEIIDCPSGSFRFVRFRQTGRNHAGQSVLQVTALEVFGTLTDKPCHMAISGGIIEHLARECGGNVHDKQVVEVTASSGDGVKNVVELGKDWTFKSKDSPNSWICYNFKGRRVTPTSYSIRSLNSAYPQSWVLEGSNDGHWWDIIDRRDDNVQMTGNFAISTPPGEGCGFMRLRQTGKNHDGNDVLDIASFEVFGTLTHMPRPIVAPGEFPFYDSYPLEGIIHHLTLEFDSDFLKTIMEVRASSQQNQASNLLRFDNCSFTSDDTPNQWILYDFKERRVTLTSYSIYPGSNYPKSWVLEVSNDDSKWEVVDRRENNHDFKVKGPVPRNFAISAPQSGASRFIRLSQTGKNHSGNDRLYIYAFEVFGTLSNMNHPVVRPGEFPFYSLKPLDGIIAHLTRQYGGNVHEKGAVVVSNERGGSDLKNVVDFESDSGCRIESGSWICYDFGRWCVTPTSYSIRSNDQLGSLRLEVSRDGSNGSWKKVDSRNNVNSSWTRNFAISRPQSGAFRFIRLFCNDSHYGGSYIHISAFELFGTLSNE